MLTRPGRLRAAPSMTRLTGHVPTTGVSQGAGADLSLQSLCVVPAPLVPLQIQPGSLPCDTKDCAFFPQKMNPTPPA